MMKQLFSKGVGFVMNNIMTESVMKSIVGVLGDYLVSSSKNKLDDKMWSSVKKKLNI
jgi:methanogenic corrinoid protein MtbC1